MKVNAIEIAAINGIEISDGTSVDDVFELRVWVQVYEIEREKIDVSSWDKTEHVDGALNMKCVALDLEHVDPIDRSNDLRQIEVAE